MTPESLLALEELLIRHEGMRLYPYSDTTGHLSIGVGHNLSSGITEKQALMILREDIRNCRSSLDKHLPYWCTLTISRQHVMVSLCFMLGISGLLGFKKMLAAISAGRFEDASAELLDSKMSGQIKGRAIELADMLRGGPNVA